MAKLLRWMIGGLSVALLAALAAPGGAPAHAQAGPTFLLSPQTQTVDLSAGTVQVQVQVQNATNVAAFGFVLRYDPAVVDQPAIQAGPFLGSAGRFVNCQPPIVDGSTWGIGTVLYGCYTLGSGTGASGSGVLANVTFHLAGGARTAVVIENDVLASADLAAGSVCGTYAAPQCPAQDGSVTVTGGNPALDRGLSPIPTPPPVQSAPAPTTGGVPVSSITPTALGASAAAGSAAPVTGAADPGAAAGAPSGTIAGASSGAPSAAAAAGADAAAAASGRTGAAVGAFGYGPQPSTNHDRR
ncbi:MAG: cohesin domain-containing protein, partial [Dehalococcoidia bacterium]